MSFCFSWEYLYGNFTEKYGISPNKTVIHNDGLNETVVKNWREEVASLVGASLDAILASQSYNKPFFKTLNEEAKLFFDEYHANLTALIRKVITEKMKRFFSPSIAKRPLFQQGAHKCKDMLLDCHWQGETVNCTDIFQESRTDVGFCCSFNAIKLAEQL